MQLCAVSYDPEMSDGAFAGEVSRVFDRSCHIRTCTGDAVFVVAEGLDCGPQAVRVSTPSQFTFAAALAPGTPVTRKADHLLFDGNKLDIDLTGAAQWSSRPLPWPCRLSAATSQIICEHLDNAAANMQWPDNAELIAATRRLKSESAQDILSRRIGLGPGLTPAGDDYIVGYMLGLNLCETGPVQRTQFRRQVSSWLGNQGHLTTDISAAFFSAAAMGRFTDNLVQLAHAASQDDTNTLAAAISAVLAQGASSGHDTLSGFADATFSWSQ